MYITISYIILCLQSHSGNNVLLRISSHAGMCINFFFETQIMCRCAVYTNSIIFNSINYFCKLLIFLYSFILVCFVYILVCLIVAMNQTFVFTKYQLKYHSCISLQAYFNLSLSIEENVLSGVFQSIHKQSTYYLIVTKCRIVTLNFLSSLPPSLPPFSFPSSP